MGVGRGEGESYPPWILKCPAKKVVFFVLRSKIQISPHMVPLEKFWKIP